MTIAPHNLTLDELINQIHRDDNAQALALIDKICHDHELTQLDDIAEHMDSNGELENAVARLNSAMDEIANICENEDFDTVDHALAAVNSFVRWERD
jgi:hypothetical protein